MGELRQLARERSTAARPPVRRRSDSPPRRAGGGVSLDGLLPARALQPQLLIGALDDPFEREAEAAAAAVTSAGGPGAITPVVRRAVGKGDPAAPDEREEKDEHKHAQRQPAGAPTAGPAPAGVEERVSAMSGSGDPLDAPTRSFFERRFGLDLGAVRVHTGGGAAAAAAAIDARAFTVGSHIFFGGGQYRPRTPEGLRLLAHELTHTVQQAPGARSIQRQVVGFGESILADLRAFAEKDFPPWELLTVLIERDPITDQPVERNARNLVQAVLKLVPDGMAIFAELERNKTIETTATWFEGEVARLELTWAKVKALLAQAWEAVDAIDLISLPRAWNKVKPIFGPTVQRLLDFVSAVGGRIVATVKKAALEKVAIWAKAKPGYTLLTFALGADPVTGEKVVRTPTGFVFAVLDLVPGGERLKASLQQSGAIERTVAWLDAEITKLDLSPEKIRELFVRAWDAFKVADLLTPLVLLEKLAAIFGEPLGRLLRFLGAVGTKILQFIFEGVMLSRPLGRQIVAIVRKLGGTFNRIVEDPVEFIGNLIEAAKRGFRQFGQNIWEHLKAGLIGWLVGALEGAGLVLPKVWDLRGILNLALQVLGISYAKMRAKLVKVLGEERVAFLERVFDFLKTLITEGPAAAWEKIVEALGNLWDMVIGGIRDWAVTKIVTAAITKLATMFNPVGALIQAVVGIYNTIAFFLERAQQIAELVEALVDSIDNIAQGKLAQAANYVERTMARTIPVILSFLARLIGLGDVSSAIKNVITAIREKVDKAIDTTIAWIVEKAKAMVGTVRQAAGALVEWWKARKAFHTADGEDHALAFEGGSPDAELIIESSPQRMTAFFGAWRSDIDAIRGDPTRTAEQDAALTDARAKYQGIRALQKELAAPVDKNAVDPARQGKVDQLAKALSELAKILARHDIGTRAPLPSPVLPAFANGVVARGFTAEYLNKDVPPGTESGAHIGSLVGWDYVVKNKLGANAAWVRMHLLPAALGGMAVDSNLVPARGPQTNTRYANAVEYPAKAALTAAAAPVREPMIWYQVDVDYHKAPAGFPRRLAVQWGGYDAKGMTWVKRKTPRGKIDEPQDVPTPGDDAILKVNREGRLRVAAVLNVGDTFARLVVDLRPSTGYVGITDLVQTLRGWELVKGGASPIAEFDDQVAAVREANRDGKVSFE